MIGYFRWQVSFPYIGSKEDMTIISEAYRLTDRGMREGSIEMILFNTGGINTEDRIESMKYERFLNYTRYKSL
jgi:hypothetical protein